MPGDAEMVLEQLHVHLATVIQSLLGDRMMSAPVLSLHEDKVT